MKTTLLALFIFVLFIHIGFAQTFTPLPGNNFTLSAPISESIIDQTVSQVDFKNITGDSIRLKWKVLERNIPSGWDYSMCDYATCRDMFLDSAEYTMYPIESSFNAYLWFHILPHSVGSAVLKVYVYDIKYPSNGETIIWTVNSITGINELNTSLRFSMFPNPASEYLNIQGDNINLKGASISLYNTLGKEVMHSICSANSFKLDLTSFNEGIYFVRVNTQEGYATRKIIVSK